MDRCAVIAVRLDEDRPTKVVRSLKLSVKSSKALREACEAIGFPPQRLGSKQVCGGTTYMLYGREQGSQCRAHPDGRDRV